MVTEEKVYTIEELCRKLEIIKAEIIEIKKTNDKIKQRQLCEVEETK